MGLVHHVFFCASYYLSNLFLLIHCHLYLDLERLLKNPGEQGLLIGKHNLGILENLIKDTQKKWVLKNKNNNNKHRSKFLLKLCDVAVIPSWKQEISIFHLGDKRYVLKTDFQEIAIGAQMNR